MSTALTRLGPCPGPLWAFHWVGVAHSKGSLTIRRGCHICCERVKVCLAEKPSCAEDKLLSRDKPTLACRTAEAVRVEYLRGVGEEGGKERKRRWQ